MQGNSGRVLTLALPKQLAGGRFIRLVWSDLLCGNDFAGMSAEGENATGAA